MESEVAGGRGDGKRGDLAMGTLTSKQIRTGFLEFFARRGHTVVESSSLLPDAPNLLFTNAGMNQFVPIFLGERACPYDPPRAVDTQKCIRAGGKHNDLEDVGFDTYHHTFFEMLGNWSFGDYFKEEAIDWAWELLVGEWGLPPERLYATYYLPGGGEPGEEDWEARELWAKKFRAVGLDVKEHVRGFGKRENFWMMGETGPCGPCSEVHIDLTAAGDTRGGLVNAGSHRCIEIWNLVFIQFNAREDGGLEPLKARHVDTGMGFERMVAIFQCTDGLRDFSRTVSNYDTDLFAPLFGKIAEMSGAKYGGRYAEVGVEMDAEVQRDCAFRVIADHVRALSFAIADGILPGNTDRNYVLRRILRRALKAGRNLGLREPFLYRLSPVVGEVMGDVFPEVRQKSGQICEVLRREEEAFLRTLDKGLAMLEEEVTAVKGRGGRELSGDFVFKLYDTYGFPHDLTALLARERGLGVDVGGFESRMAEQRERARAAQKRTTIEVLDTEGLSPTEFVGYEQLETEAQVTAASWDGKVSSFSTNVSVFYAEMGGQVGDSGEAESGGRLWRIEDTRKVGRSWLHKVEGGDEPPEEGARVKLRVDARRRMAISRHHTVTHILHWALREVLGRGVSQRGSYVGPEKLTFDFNSAPLSVEQIETVERLVNERILEDAGVSWVEVPYAEVKPRGDIQQFFGEKYGEVVRVVQIGGREGSLDGYSMELCGGTHVRRTGQIGLFAVVGENAVAAGIRRIEAVAGMESLRKAREESRRLRGIAAMLGCPLGEIENRLEVQMERAKALEKQMQSLRQKQAAEFAKEVAKKAERVRDVPFLGIEVEMGAEDALTLANSLKIYFQGVCILLAKDNGKVHVICQVSEAYQGKYPAGKLVGEAAKRLGGKGGGKADFARGGGVEVGKCGEALEVVRGILAVG